MSSIHAHGVFYGESSDGAPYDDAVAPGTAYVCFSAQTPDPAAFTHGSARPPDTLANRAEYA